MWVYSVSRCAFCLGHTKPKACAGFLPMPHRFQKSQALSLSWLLPDPGSFAFPYLSRFLALTDPLVLCSWAWAVRLMAGGAGEGRRRSRARLTVSRRGLCCCLQAISTNVHEPGRLRRRTRQGADQIAEIYVDPSQGYG